MSLKEIKATDLLFTNEIEDDRTNTFLSLDDYDWMSYRLRTRFRTKELGTLEVEFEYFGMVTSSMKVKQTLDKKTKEYVYSYSTDIFEKYLKRYLEKHLSFWGKKYAFNGEEEVIDFYNEVLKVGTLTDGIHLV